MKRDRLILFAKAPIPGRVKTRLSALIDTAAANDLHTAFVLDSCELLMGFSGVADIELCLDAPAAVWSECGCASTMQGDGGLGERLLRAMSRALSEGCRQVMVIGSDSPGLPASHIQAMLETPTEAALGPTEDGGYYAIQCRRVAPAMFEGVRWSTRHTLEDTTDALKACGFSVSNGPSWFDVDEPADLLALARRPDLPRHTADWLRANPVG